MTHEDKPKTGSDLFSEYVRVFFPELGAEKLDARELDAIGSIMTESVTELFSTLTAILGTTSLEDRLCDLARNNPITGGDGIPIVYVPRPSHSHNMLVGIPYTGVLAGRFPNLNSIVAHEMTHIVTGKFNDAITEPVASLFIKDRRYGIQNQNRISLNPSQLISLAVLELFDQNARLADLGSLEDMFSHHPQDRIITGLRFEYDKQHCGQGSDPAKLTQQFLHMYLAAFYHEDLRSHRSLGLNRPTAQEEHQLNQWLAQHAQPAYAAHRHNPNETRDVVRNFHGFLDNNLTNYLLEKGLEGKTPESCSPDEARESVRRLLEFYYAPHTSLKLYGLASFDELQATMLEEYRDRFDELPFHDHNREFLLDWLQLKDDLRENPCYQAETWGNEPCIAQRGPDAGGPVEAFVGKYYRRGMGGGPSDSRSPQQQSSPPPPEFHPVIKRAQQDPDGKPLISFTEKLGKDLNLAQYCALP